MNRNIEKLESEKFDLLIIGGGVTGASIAWDASLRGLKTALIEKDDFGHATSAATSKLIHGGLRYLQSLEFSVVRESLKERRLLERNMPHLAFPQPFLLPVYDYSPVPKWILKIGLLLYDLLSFDKNELPYPEKFLPNHEWLSKKKALEFEPRLNANGLKGAFLYYDVLNKYPERANLEYVLSASEKGAVIANYVEFKSINYEKTNSKERIIKDIVAHDRVAGKDIRIQAAHVVNAAGPWVDLVLAGVTTNMKKTIIRSKGIHLLIPKVNQNCAIAFTTKEKKHFFVIPWLDYTLLGTTDEKFTGNLDDVYVTTTEAKNFLKLVQEYYPVEFGIDNIQHVYAGIRPLAVDGKADSTYTVSRKHELISHLITDGIRGLYTVIGGKWTTSRALAELVVDKVIQENKLPYGKSRTSITPVTGGRLDSGFDQALQKTIAKYSDIKGSIVEHLFSYLGTNSTRILEMIRENPGLGKTVGKSSFLTRAEIEYAVLNESVVSLSDFLMRRSLIGNTGIPETETLREIAEIIGNMLKWTKSRRDQEIQNYLSQYRLRNE